MQDNDLELALDIPVSTELHEGKLTVGRSSYANPTGVSAMTNMNEINAGSFTKTGQPDMSDTPFNFPEIQQPEFRAPRRI